MEENLSQEEIVRKQMYEALKGFFKSDMKIKEAMSKLAPTEMDQGNEIEYIDKLYKFLKETESQFMKISKDFKFGPQIIQSLKDFFDKAEESLLSNAYNAEDIQNVFRKQVSNMDENLIEEVKENYEQLVLISEHLSKLINKAKTVNELLHVIHFYISNNENILQSMPIIDSRRNEVSKAPMVLYGEKTELAQKLFDAIPSDLDCGRHTDIISMQDRILMMIRDRGHALTIDIDSSDEKGDILVKYFVAKLCNEEMIKKLPGVGNISPNGASGMFLCKKDEFLERLFNFIEKVPTDADIPCDIKSFINGDNPKKNSMVEEGRFHTFEIGEARQIAMRY